ncbi:cation transporter [Bernardetia sp.]|uniref:cation transporter n=1 Tax=Bernardetia sp. TaxID=1937974 RepID=UPI0025C3F2DC|nr:cation transporter [Bernardetia sp.]
MQKTLFKITKMDCPSEENLIRMKLDSVSSIKSLDFDIPNRELTVFYIEQSPEQNELQRIEKAIFALNLGAQTIHTEHTKQDSFRQNQSQNTAQRKLLWIVLGINFSFFTIEILTGLISQSMGLVADSLDMLADAFVYGISLMAVGKSLLRKQKIAKVAGYFQIALACIGFVEVLRRFFSEETLPDFQTMIIVSLLALFANGICLYLMQKSKSKDEIHIKASLIFTSNDVIINTGVIAAGVLVYCFSSALPDLIIGTIVFVLVVQGAIRILKLSK